VSDLLSLVLISTSNTADTRFMASN